LIVDICAGVVARHKTPIVTRRCRTLPSLERSLREHSMRPTCGQLAHEVCTTCASLCCVANFVDCEANRGNFSARG
jgi:hypothetical protein